MEKGYKGKITIAIKALVFLLLVSSKSYAQQTSLPLSVVEGLKEHSKLKSDLKNDYIGVVDYSKLSTEPRFYLVDVANKTIQFQVLVSHAENTGYARATEFSNVINSKKSTYGRFRTGELYIGKNGLSLRIDGLDKGINDNVRRRLIVIHAAHYVSEDYVEANVILGRSEGCFAIPYSNHKTILEKLSDGRFFFVYVPQKFKLNK
ncbi:TPA: murein L,D-transpeptidase catalytic domain family protein [Vibrio vulnificus]|uniref:Murein L,D-transpeptidase catalytic domain family protein n=1 Tax=Vibrio vulnificus TaxID=672 RepID=A0A8H9K5B4_VIBVL|nr:murein L,D-transpeptidase catalytic domain family protein [Vibrio vulnificus]HAS8538384.1 murein L,D-transpeptidase catalytic domain family protein [Vibrio vulnificus]